MSGFHKSPSRLRYLVCRYRNDDVANLLEDHDYESAFGDMPKHAASATAAAELPEPRMLQHMIDIIRREPVLLDMLHISAWRGIPDHLRPSHDDNRFESVVHAYRAFQHRAEAYTPVHSLQGHAGRKMRTGTDANFATRDSRESGFNSLPSRFSLPYRGRIPSSRCCVASGTAARMAATCSASSVLAHAATNSRWRSGTTFHATRPPLAPPT